MEWNKSLLAGLRQSYMTLLQCSVFQIEVYDVPDEFDDLVVLVADIQSQTLFRIHQAKASSCYPVSTALNGIGCGENTGCTPFGWHRISKKIGHNSVAGTVFQSRQPTGVADSLLCPDDNDLITSRILWLTGLEPGVNRGSGVDSYDRYIYIHGTAQEQLIGKPVSHGCIRMRNDDVIELFEIVDETSLVFLCADINKDILAFQ